MYITYQIGVLVLDLYETYWALPLAHFRAVHPNYLSGNDIYRGVVALIDLCPDQKKHGRYSGMPIAGYLFELLSCVTHLPYGQFTVKHLTNLSIDQFTF